MSLMQSDDEDLIRDHNVPSKAGKLERDANERTRLLGNDDDDEDDDFFLSGPTVGNSLKSGTTLAGVQQQIHDVTEVMRDNVSRMLDRGDRLDDLQMRSANLDASSSEFRSAAARTRRKMWWQNAKAKAIAGAGASFLVIIIIIISFW